MALTKQSALRLFGPTPEDLARESRENKAAGYLNLMKGKTGYDAAGAGAGLALGTIVGSLFGSEDPALTKAKNIRQIFKDVSQEFPNDTLAQMDMLSQRLGEEGYTEESVMASARAEEMLKAVRDEQLKVRELDIKEKANELQAQTNLLSTFSTIANREDQLKMKQDTLKSQVDTRNEKMWSSIIDREMADKEYWKNQIAGITTSSGDVLQGDTDQGGQLLKRIAKNLFDARTDRGLSVYQSPDQAIEDAKLIVGKLATDAGTAYTGFFDDDEFDVNPTKLKTYTDAIIKKKGGSLDLDTGTAIKAEDQKEEQNQNTLDLNTSIQELLKTLKNQK